MDGGQSVCAVISSSHYASLAQEVRRNEGGALKNRANLAARFRAEGLLREAEMVESEAEVMREIAMRMNVKIE